MLGALLTLTFLANATDLLKGLDEDVIPAVTIFKGVGDIVNVGQDILEYNLGGGGNRSFAADIQAKLGEETAAAAGPDNNTLGHVEEEQMRKTNQLEMLANLTKVGTQKVASG
jgi:hypothetical protein